MMAKGKSGLVALGHAPVVGEIVRAKVPMGDDVLVRAKVARVYDWSRHGFDEQYIEVVTVGETGGQQYLVPVSHLYESEVG